MGLPTALFIVFLIMKLLGVIDWSWWLVTAPLWIEFILSVIIIGFFGGLAVLLNRGDK